MLRQEASVKIEAKDKYFGIKLQSLTEDANFNYKLVILLRALLKAWLQKQRYIFYKCFLHHQMLRGHFISSLTGIAATGTAAHVRALGCLPSKNMGALRPTTNKNNVTIMTLSRHAPLS
jgi:hypothetical protein